ncbi:MAG TPA: bacteriocin [Kofleriaceae bacterium]
MKTLSDAELAHVTGGKGPDATTVTPGAGGSSSSNNDAVLGALHGIQSSLKDLGNKPQGLFGGNNGLMFMTMALAMSRRSEVVVYGGGPRRGYSWRAYW